MDGKPHVDHEPTAPDRTANHDTRPAMPRSPYSAPNLASLPRLNTQVTPRSLLGQHRSSAHVNKRISNISGASVAATQRPESDVYPLFHSSLDYALVRDFAYPSDSSLHYGPDPEGPSNVTTPASEISRRMSDPEVHRFMGSVQEEDDNSYFQLSRRTFGDSPEDARYLGQQTGHRRGRSSVLDYDSGRAMHRGTDGRGQQEANRILYPDLDVQYYQYAATQDEFSQAIPELQTTDSPSQSPSEAYDDEDFDALASPDDGYPGKAITLFDFQQENDNELPFIEGQVLWVKYKNGEGWLVAMDPKTGLSGLVPEEYVRLLRDIEGGLNGLKDEGFALDSPEGIDAETPTDTQMPGGAHFADYALRSGAHSEKNGTSMLDAKAAESSSQEVTPTINLSSDYSRQG